METAYRDTFSIKYDFNYCVLIRPFINFAHEVSFKLTVVIK